MRFAIRLSRLRLPLDLLQQAVEKRSKQIPRRKANLGSGMGRPRSKAEIVARGYRPIATAVLSGLRT
jgi:hypothetical protein